MKKCPECGALIRPLPSWVDYRVEFILGDMVYRIIGIGDQRSIEKPCHWDNCVWVEPLTPIHPNPFDEKERLMISHLAKELAEDLPLPFTKLLVATIDDLYKSQAVSGQS